MNKIVTRGVILAIILISSIDLYCYAEQQGKSFEQLYNEKFTGNKLFSLVQNIRNNQNQTDIAKSLQAIENENLGIHLQKLRLIINIKHRQILDTVSLPTGKFILKQPDRPGGLASLQPQFEQRHASNGNVFIKYLAFFSSYDKNADDLFMKDITFILDDGNVTPLAYWYHPLATDFYTISQISFKQTPQLCFVLIFEVPLRQIEKAKLRIKGNDFSLINLSMIDKDIDKYVDQLIAEDF